MITGAVSGYFNPLHVGHIDMIRDAKSECDYLIVIVNNDVQRELKGSKPFMTELERVKIMMSLKDVDEVFLSIDKDVTVCESLKHLRPSYFFNGGDRNSTEAPETEVCNKYGILTMNHIGGKKVQSSSNLLK